MTGYVGLQPESWNWFKAKISATVAVAPLFLGVALLALTFCTLAAHADSFPARLFGQEDGLENLVISAIAQDKQGYLWVATNNGVFRYDGAEFQEFGRNEGFLNPNILALLVDSQGRIWAGNHSGLYRLEGSRFVEVTYKGQSLRIGMNSMLASTSAGELVAESRNDTFSVMIDPQDQLSIVPYAERHPAFTGVADPNGIAVDSADQLWIGCGTEVCVSTPSGLRRLGLRDGVPADFYVSIFRTREGRMWARGRKYILCWDEDWNRPSAKDTVHARDLTAGLPPGAITTVYRRFSEDAYGHILVPTGSGFAAWDGRHWQETTSTSKGPIHGATAIFSDREGTVWVGTEGAGLLQSLGYGHWNNFSSADGLSNPSVNAIAADRGRSIWLGNSQMTNLLRRENGPFSPLHGAARSLASLTLTALTLAPLPAIAEAANVASLAPSPDGGMWAATVLGHIFHVDRSGRTDARMAIDAYIARLRLDARGTLWIASSDGIFTVDCVPPKLCQARRFSPAMLGGANFQDILLDGHGGAWLAGEHGLYRVQHPADHRADHRDDHRDDHSRPVSQTDAQPAEVTNVLVTGEPQHFNLIAPGEDGTLWLAGQMPGVIHVRPEGRTARVIESFTRPQIASDDVEFLDQDLLGRLWIGTDHGLQVLAHGKLSRITAEDGLIWNDAGSRAFLADPDGSVWIGTSQGVSHLLDPEAVLGRDAFDAAIDGASYNDRSFVTASSVPWHGGITLLRFTGLTFRDNQSLVYHYQLDGFDSSSVTTHSHFARFQKLPPGHYTFRVVAEDPVHGIFSKPAEFQFTLAPPWWRTDLSLTLFTLLLVLAVAGLWHASHLALLAQRRKLTTLVAERTSELEKMAVCDSLTGLLNRRAILSALEETLKSAQEQRTAVCVALIDLDHFKRINDTLGHLAGDEVLRQSAQRLASSIRTTDVVGRYGGEEFLIIFRNMEQEPGAARCEIVRQSLCKEPIAWESHRLTITCSIGVASSRTSVPALVASADHAMYTAKSQGRNRVVCAMESPMGMGRTGEADRLTVSLTTSSLSVANPIPRQQELQ